MSRCTEWLMLLRLSPRQRQWAWFVVLWCAGLGSALGLGWAVRKIMGL